MRANGISSCFPCVSSPSLILNNISMQSIRWSLLCLVLLAPLSIGCGGGAGTPVGSQDELERWAAENPDAANEDDALLSEGEAVDDY